MSRSDIAKELLSRRPPKDNSDIESLVKAIRDNANDTNKTIEVMLTFIKAMSEKDNRPSAPEVNVNVDMQPLIDEIQRIPQSIPRQEVNIPNMSFDTTDLAAAFRENQMQRQAISYEFNIKRGTNNKIVSIIATPM